MLLSKKETLLSRALRKVIYFLGESLVKFIKSARVRAQHAALVVLA